MIKQLTISFFLILVLINLQAQVNQEEYILGSYNNISLQEFIEEMENKYNTRIFFKKEWIDSIYVNISIDSTPISEAFKEILKPTTLTSYFQIPNRIFIIPKDKKIQPLPQYQKIEGEKSENTNTTQKLSIEKKYMKGREPDMIETIIIGKSEKAKFGKHCTINGILIDQDSGEPLIGATIFLKDINKGSATDIYGTLSLALKPSKYSAIFQCMGMADIKCILDVKSDGYFTLSMTKEVTSIAEVTVKAGESNKRGSKVGLEKISIQSIKELPTLMGEKDVIKISQMLPGIVSVSEGSGGVNVRGGNADQNLFFINDVPIYNTSHVFGFFSSINSTIINDFSIHKGLVPAKYGGRLSSVFNIETRKGNKRKLFMQGGISPISANVEIEAPIIKDKCSFMLSGRSSYSDWILNKMTDPELRNSSVSFYDFAGALEYKINKTNQLSIFAYNSNDEFAYNSLTDYQYSNLGGAINFLHRFSPALKSQITVTGTNYKFSTAEQPDPSSAFTHNYILGHYEAKGNINWVFNEKHTISAGGNIILYQLNKGKVEPIISNSESFVKPIDLGEEQGTESALFLDEKYTVNSWLDIYGGIRFSSFSEIGPKTVLTYNENSGKNEKNVLDTLVYQSGDKIINYNGPEFRAAANFTLNQFNSVKLSYNQMRQYIFMLSNTFSISPTDQWKLVDYHIKPPKSHQVSIGYYTKIPSLGISATSEAYYKYANNIVEYKDGADFLSTPYVETTILQGNQKAYGLELMLSKDDGKLNGWISYTYSRSIVSVDGGYDWNSINDGKSYPSNFDKPNVCNVVLNYKINRRFSISSNLSYSTGRPITLPEGAYYIDSKPYVDYSSRNEYRIPDYFRVDASLTIEGNLKSKKPFHSFWMFSVYNISGRNNAYSVYFKSENGHINGYKYSIIGEPIFTIAWNFKLGNYTND